MVNVTLTLFFRDPTLYQNRIISESRLTLGFQFCTVNGGRTLCHVEED